jgi:hypothetical protein
MVESAKSCRTRNEPARPVPPMIVAIKLMAKGDGW